MASISVVVDEEVYKGLEEVASRLNVGVEELVGILMELAYSYRDYIASMGEGLRVRRENKARSVLEEVFYYGVEAWRGVVDKVLDRLKARGRFELEELDLDPDEPSIEMELVALEGSDLRVDRVRINWSIDGVIVEAYYYIGEYYEHVPARVGRFDVAYHPDEEAVVVTRTGSRLADIPPLHEFDRVVEELGV